MQICQAGSTHLPLSGNGTFKQPVRQEPVLPHEQYAYVQYVPGHWQMSSPEAELSGEPGMLLPLGLNLLFPKFGYLQARHHAP